MGLRVDIKRLKLLIRTNVRARRHVTRGLWQKYPESAFLIAAVFDHASKEQRIDILKDIDTSVSEKEDMSKVINLIKELSITDKEASLIKSKELHQHRT